MVMLGRDKSTFCDILCIILLLLSQNVTHWRNNIMGEKWKINNINCSREGGALVLIVAVSLSLRGVGDMERGKYYSLLQFNNNNAPSTKTKPIDWKLQLWDRLLLLHLLCVWSTSRSILHQKGEDEEETKEITWSLPEGVVPQIGGYDNLNQIGHNYRGPLKNLWLVLIWASRRNISPTKLNWIPFENHSQADISAVISARSSLAFLGREARQIAESEQCIQGR